MDFKELMAKAQKRGVDLKETLEKAIEAAEPEVKRYLVEVEVTEDTHWRYTVKVTDTLTGKEDRSRVSLSSEIRERAKDSIRLIKQELKEDKLQNEIEKVFYLDEEDLNEGNGLKWSN